MKQILFALTAVLLTQISYSQVAISNPASVPHSSAMLDVQSTTKGFLMPRVALRTDVVSPATGLLVYETASNAVWVYNGTAWAQLGSGGGASQWLTNGTHIYNSNTGNVGIGITSPLSKFHVAGNMLMDATNATLQLQAAGVDKGFMQLSGDNMRIGTNSSNSLAKFIIRTGGSDRVFVDSIGQVGIGKSSPKFDLDVNGNARIQSQSPLGKSILSLYANPYHQFDTYGSAGLTFFNWASLGGGDFDYNAKFRFELLGGITERLKLYHVDYDNQLVLSKTGNVGINSASPSEKLEVAGNVQIENPNPLLKLRRNSATAIGDYGIQFNTNTNVTVANIMYADGKLKLNHGATAGNDFVIDGSSIGVGTETPEEKLHVIGNIKINTFNPFIKLQQLTVDKGFVDVNGDDLRIGTYAGNPTGSVRVRVNNLERMNINPEGTMSLINGQDAGLSSNGYLMFGFPNGNNLILDNNEIMARTNGVAGSLVLQNDGGSVRIGNVAVPSGYKFAINGKMYCEELRVKLSANWPDYVFNKNYKLLPLAELKKFIETNNHLPNIPKASVIEKEGIEVGDMQKKLMEKVEELTLYILDLQKQVDELKTKPAANK